jgi:HlyD family secretion protein
MDIKQVLNNKLYWAGGAVVVTALGFGGFMMLGGGKAKVGKYEYEFVTVEKGDVSRIISASGTVQPLNVTDVGSQVSGKVVEVIADYNTVVKKDQVLARIDPETFQTGVNSAEARLQQSEASVSNAKSSISRSEVALDVATNNYERNKKLYAQQAIATAAWEAAERDYKNAKIQLDTDKASLKSAEAGLAQSRASLQDARTNLARTYIRSPIDGVVIDRRVNVGQTVQSSMSVANLFKIAQDLSQIQIEASVVEGDIGGIDENDTVNFTVDAHQGRRFQGRVKQVRKQGTEQANVVTYTVVIEARNPENILLPGMTANVDITADRAQGVLRVANDVTRFQPPKDILEAMNKRDAANRPPGQGAPGAGPGGGGQMAGFQGGGQGGRPGGGQGGQGGGNRGPGGGGNRGMGGPQQAEMMKEMGISEAQSQKIQAEMQSEMQKIMASMPQMPQQQGGPMGGGGMGGPPPQMMQQQAMQEMRMKMERLQEDVMKRNLSEEQYTKYMERRAEMQSRKPATVYTVNAQGELERHRIQIGISDSSYAQVVGGAKEGDKFVLRVKPPAQPQQKK